MIKETIRADINSALEHLNGAIVGSEQNERGIGCLDSLEQSFNQIIDELKACQRSAEVRFDLDPVKFVFGELRHHFTMESTTNDEKSTARVFGEYLSFKINKVLENWDNFQE